MNKGRTPSTSENNFSTAAAKTMIVSLLLSGFSFLSPPIVQAQMSPQAAVVTFAIASAIEKNRNSHRGRVREPEFDSSKPLKPRPVQSSIEDVLKSLGEKPVKLIIKHRETDATGRVVKLAPGQTLYSVIEGPANQLTSNYETLIGAGGGNRMSAQIMVIAESNSTFPLAGTRVAAEEDIHQLKALSSKDYVVSKNVQLASAAPEAPRPPRIVDAPEVHETPNVQVKPASALLPSPSRLSRVVRLAGPAAGIAAVGAAAASAIRSNSEVPSTEIARIQEIRRDHEAREQGQAGSQITSGSR